MAWKPRISIRVSRANKLGAERCQFGDEKFDSRAEMRRYGQLLMLLKAKEITGLSRQISFGLAPSAIVAGKKKRPLTYRADFVYIDNKGNMIIEDVKGHITAVYVIKRHLMKTVHGIDILEVS